MSSLGEVPDCERCQADAERQAAMPGLWEKTKHDFPPEKCKRCISLEILDEASITAWSIFQSVQTQVSFTFGGEWIGIDHAAIWRQIDERGVTRSERMETFHRVQMVEDVYRSKQNSKIRRDAKAAKNKSRSSGRR